jgi:hypothetical protein
MLMPAVTITHILMVMLSSKFLILVLNSVLENKSNPVLLSRHSRVIKFNQSIWYKMQNTDAKDSERYF